MSVSYMAVAIFHRNGQNITHTKVFTSKRARTESPKELAKADKWAAELLREHGTHGCRIYLSKVIWAIGS